MNNEQLEDGGFFMVKGLSRRAVLVRFPETGLFEEAVFVVREDKQCAHGITAEQILAEACQIAQTRNPGRTNRKATVPPAVYAAVGALSVGVAWVLTMIFG